jgi:hypothetical protein
MPEVIIAVGLGAASGVLGVLAYRFGMAWLAWLTLAPLAIAVYMSPPIAAALAGAACGALITGGNRQVHDAAGRVAARASSLDGPCALVVDVPTSMRAAQASQSRSEAAVEVR